MNKSKNEPSFIFETSWEVCNKVGGIYTVLSTRAKTMLDEHGDNVLFVGPYIPNKTYDDFIPNNEKDDTDIAIWAKDASEDLQMNIKVGRWRVPGQPMVALIDYKPLFDQKDALYFEAWKNYGIDGTVGYGDYDDSCLFSAAAAMLMNHAYCKLLSLEQQEHCVAIFNEWMTGFGLLWLKWHQEAISSIFITHATSIGRSICGNGKPLYGHLSEYNGDQMAKELNVLGKHQIEKACAHEADGFATVSEVTNQECTILLEKAADVVLPNGFEPHFVPEPDLFEKKRCAARQRLLQVASKLYGEEIPDNAFILSSSGRLEFRNKGLDLFLDVLGKLSDRDQIGSLVAFVFVPAWVDKAREDLIYALNKDLLHSCAMQYPYLTHWLNNMEEDPILNKAKQMHHYWQGKVKLVYVPSYLNGSDGVLNQNYYDILSGVDLSVYPSYYEPWGYTPLESVAFSIPTITTDLSGFGRWYLDSETLQTEEHPGVVVAHRTDDNYNEACSEIAERVMQYHAAYAKDPHLTRASQNAVNVSKEAYWKSFYCHYRQLYKKVLHQKQPEKVILRTV